MTQLKKIHDVDYDIRNDLEEKLDQRANIDAATEWSTIDDQTMMDLEEDGYDDQSAVMIADLGYETVVNGDVFVPPYFEKELKLKRTKHPKQWREHTNRSGKNAAYLLGGWLVKNGYKKPPKYGGKVFSKEAGIALEWVVDAVMNEQKGYRRADVERVARKEYGDAEYVYRGSFDGDTELWAKPARAENRRKVAAGGKRNPDVTRKEWQQALKKDQADLKKYEGYLRRLERGEKVGNMTISGVKKTISGLRQTIRNKEALIAQKSRQPNPIAKLKRNLTRF